MTLENEWTRSKGKKKKDSQCQWLYLPCSDDESVSEPRIFSPSTPGAGSKPEALAVWTSNLPVANLEGSFRSVLVLRTLIHWHKSHKRGVFT